jgi:spore germination protein GerM
VRIRRWRAAGIARAAVALLAVASTLAGCGVPTDSSPQDVASDDLPAALRNVPATSTTVEPGPRDLAIVYWIRGEKLVRSVAPVTEPATVRSVLDVLQQGPVPGQAKAGDRSALDGTSLIRRVSIAGRMAVIDLAPSFANLLPSDQVLALAQLVLTATERPEISDVRLTVGGEVTQLPRADGSLTTAPLEAADYRALVVR